MSTDSYLEQLIKSVCASADLASYDPYDVWKTKAGFRAKNFYNHSPKLGLVPVAALTLFDTFINNESRRFYTVQEFPIVRATAAMALMKLWSLERDTVLLEAARKHLDWLIDNRSLGYQGYCWGLGFPNAVSRNLTYDGNTPYSTMTPYALEAMVMYTELTGDARYECAIQQVFRFFDCDLHVMEEDATSMATSYAPFRDRTVINAATYTMYSYALCLPWLSAADNTRIRQKIQKLYGFVRKHQRSDGSWFYSPYERSFIDCFHSCIVLKNLLKTDRIVRLDGVTDVIGRGYDYLRNDFLNKEQFLFKRFSIRNKQGLTRFDLYDNAEMLNLAVLLEDMELAAGLRDSIVRHFCRGSLIYSQIDITGRLRNKNTLRWAVVPFLHAAAQHLVMLRQDRAAIRPAWAALSN